MSESVPAEMSSTRRNYVMHHHKAETIGVGEVTGSRGDPELAGGAWCRWRGRPPLSFSDQWYVVHKRGRRSV